MELGSCHLSLDNVVAHQHPTGSVAGQRGFLERSHKLATVAGDDLGIFKVEGDICKTQRGFGNVGYWLHNIGHAMFHSGDGSEVEREVFSVSGDATEGLYLHSLAKDSGDGCLIEVERQAESVPFAAVKVLAVLQKHGACLAVAHGPCCKSIGLFHIVTQDAVGLQLAELSIQIGEAVLQIGLDGGDGFRIVGKTFLLVSCPTLGSSCIVLFLCLTELGSDVVEAGFERGFEVASC